MLESTAKIPRYKKRNPHFAQSVNDSQYAFFGIRPIHRDLQRKQLGEDVGRVLALMDQRLNGDLPCMKLRCFTLLQRSGGCRGCCSGQNDGQHDELSFDALHFHVSFHAEVSSFKFKSPLRNPALGDSKASRSCPHGGIARAPATSKSYVAAGRESVQRNRRSRDEPRPAIGYTACR